MHLHRVSRLHSWSISMHFAHLQCICFAYTCIQQMAFDCILVHSHTFSRLAFDCILVAWWMHAVCRPMRCKCSSVYRRLNADHIECSCRQLHAVLPCGLNVPLGSSLPVTSACNWMHVNVTECIRREMRVYAAKTGCIIYALSMQNENALCMRVVQKCNWMQRTSENAVTCKAYACTRMQM